MPDLDDILAALGTMSISLGVGLAVGALVSVMVGVGVALVALGLIALTGFELLRRTAPTGGSK